MNDRITGVIFNRAERRRLGWHRTQHWERPHRQRIIKLRRFVTIAGVTWVLTALTATPTLATGVGYEIVYDPTNYAQNLQTAINSVSQVQNQYSMITNQIKQLEYTAKNLSGSPTNLQYQIKAVFQNIQNMQRYINGLMTDYDTAMTAWDKKYPQFASYNRMSASDYATNARSMIQEGNDRIQAAYQTNALTSENSATNQANLDTLMNASASSSGTLSALQVGHQIAQIQCEQLNDLVTVARQSSNAQNAYLEIEVQKQMKQQTDIDSFNSMDVTSPTTTPFDDPMLN